MIHQWSARKPPGRGDLSVDPRDLACLLGNLVFVSEAVRGGRTYLQCCLGSFKGLEVDCMGSRGGEAERDEGQVGRDGRGRGVLA